MRKAYCGNPDAQWIGDSMPQIDPLKEIGAAKMRIDLGVSTLDRETSSLGCGDFQDNQPQIRKDRKFVEEVGLWAPISQKNEAVTDKGQVPEKKKKMPTEEEETEMEEAA